MIFRRHRQPLDPAAAARAAALDRAIAAWQHGEAGAAADPALSAAQALAAAGDAGPAAPHEPIVALRAAIAARARRGWRATLGGPAVRRAIPAVALAAVVAMAIVPQLDTPPDSGPTGNRIAKLVAAADGYFEAAATAPDPQAQKEALAQATKLVEQAQVQAAKLPDDGRERILASLQTKIDLLQHRVDELESQLAAGTTTTSTTTTTTTSPETTTSTSSTTSTTRPSSGTTTTTTSPPSSTSTTSPTTSTTRPPTTTTTEPSVDVAAQHERRP
jgi:hypothetical protein